jgi:putative Mg2+ transporter-C (MgtC) family protein
MMMEMFTFDGPQFLSYIVKIGIAFGLTLPIALNREQSARQMGLRTFPLVAISSCGYVLIATAIISADADDAQMRVIQGLMTGIGFVGGGAILKDNAQVHGTATAASIWSTGALGAAVGYEQYEIAIIISLINFLTLILLNPAKKLLNDGQSSKNNKIDTVSID